MKMYVFEGTAEEIAKVAATMQPMTPLISEELEGGKSTGVVRGLPKPSEDIEKYVTKKFAKRALTRLELSDPIKGMMKRLFDAGENWISTQDVYKASGYGQAQFAGMMGAFGRRMSYTEGFEEDAHFFDYRWDEDEESWEYRLPESVIEAIKETAVL